MEVYSSSSIGLQKMMIANIHKTLAFYPKGSRNLTYSNKREQSLVVVNTLKNSGAEPQSGVVVTIVTKEGDGGYVGKDLGVLEGSYGPRTDCGNGGGDVFGGNNGNGSNGKWLGGGGGGGDNREGGDEEGEEDDDEFGPIMKFEDVMKETEARGASLPLDMLEAAKSGGLRELLLLRYLELQV